MAKAGQPTKLTPGALKTAQDYIAENDGLGSVALLPTIERLALKLDVHRDTLYAWAETNKQFSDILEKLRASQADKLIQRGLEGRYNATITKLMLTKHGYVDKQELTGAEGAPLMPVALDATVLARNRNGAATRKPKADSQK